MIAQPPSRTTDEGPVPQDRLRVWRRFLEAHAYVVELLTQELKDREQLPLSWYDVLVQLSEAPGRRLRMQELADAVLISKSGLTRLADRLEDEGLIEREACPTDRRGTFATLTRAGQDLLDRTSATHLEGVHRHFTSHLTEDEVTALDTALTRVVAATGRGDG